MSLEDIMAGRVQVTTQPMVHVLAKLQILCANAASNNCQEPVVVKVENALNTDNIK